MPVRGRVVCAILVLLAAGAFFLNALTLTALPVLPMREWSGLDLVRQAATMMRGREA